VPSDVQTVCDAIARQRKYGHLTCTVDDRKAAVDPRGCRVALDEFVSTFGFKALANAWIEISIQAAKTLVREILLKDLAYRIAMMSEEEAALLAESFFALFDDSVRCFTNGNLVVPDADPTEVPGSWNPITEATFDAGVVCLGHSRIGILWVEDED
jgi:hypothetical protein